jgi:hypothetical protein
MRLVGQMGFTNAPWDHLADKIGHHFDKDSRAAPESVRTICVLPNWPKINNLTDNWKMYKEFHARIP